MPPQHDFTAYQPHVGDPLGPNQSTTNGKPTPEAYSTPFTAKAVPTKSKSDFTTFQSHVCCSAPHYSFTQEALDGLKEKPR